MHSLEKRVLLPEDLKPLNSLAEYKAKGGLKGLEKALKMSPKDVVAEVKKSGLRGRGGAGFPTAVKWQTVIDDPSKNKFVVCNMAEGEPGTNKDRYLISKNPYLIFEGMLIVSYAINAKKAILGTKEKFKPTVLRLQNALKELEDAGVVKKGFIEIVLGPDEYLLGEEKALLEVIDGRAPMPRMYPPFMVGVGYTPTETNPTVVNNAESMMQLPLILNNGADWFRSRGTEDTPGTVVFTLSGDVKRPGMYEVETGLTVKQLLYDLGGGPVGKSFKAVFSGVANRVMTPEQFDLKIDFGTLRAAGLGLGSGGFIVYDETACMVDVAWMFSHFLSQSSCGQCIPCNRGTRIITEHLYKLRGKKGTESNMDDIIAETGRCTIQTRCFLPVQESALVGSIMSKFSKEFKDHTKKGCTFDRKIVIPKIESFDEEKGQFVYEKKPKEFLS